MGNGVGERQAEAEQGADQGDRRRGVAGADQAELAPRRDHDVDQQEQPGEGEAHDHVAHEIREGLYQPLQLGHGRLSTGQPCMVKPPDTLSVCPVMKAASSLARKQTAPGMSSGCPTRFMGMALTRAARILSARSPSPAAAASRGVSVGPGQTALRVMPLRATSRATVLVKAMMPP